MKIVKYLMLLLVCVMAASCGSDEAGKVEQKIKDGVQPTQEDYKVMIEYCGKFAEDAQKIQDEINMLPAESQQQGKLDDRMATLSEKYPYVSTFSERISNCTKEEIGEKNVELVNKYAPLMWFSAPSWANIGSDVNLEGFIEDMPTSDTSGVISTGDGIEVK